ncbi:hypothetical protein KKC65_02595 [Patescibacteria group bacterium]|nr:hypothetical protein [Patescibacteria group bacterium]
MPSTQDFLKFDQIKEGVVILKNKGLRLILMVSSLNFALKSVDEQNAILYQFQNFLNSLDFPAQIIVQSRRLNMTGYLDKLTAIEEKETNELMKIQVGEYRKFIEQIVGGGSIMQKTFYVIVPFSVSEMMFAEEGKRIPKIPQLTEDAFQRAKNQLLQRAEFVMLGLGSSGLEAVPLTNLEIAELFWSLHHPIEAERGYYPEIPSELIE